MQLAALLHNARYYARPPDKTQQTVYSTSLYNNAEKRNRTDW